MSDDAVIPNPHGIVYVLENEAMPGIVKIGFTCADLSGRIQKLSSSTSVPAPFHCIYAARVANPLYVEQHIHAAFAPYRTSPRKEFFRIPPECAVAVLELVAIDVVTPTDDVPLNQSEKLQLEATPNPGGYVVRTLPTGRFGQPQAEHDLLAYIAENGFAPSQDFLVARWGRSKATVSYWLNELETRGVISRQRDGKAKIIVAGPTLGAHISD